MSTDTLLALIASAQREVTRQPCAEGDHDWVSVGGRRCPEGAEGCSQAVYRCRHCGVYDHGDHADSPALVDCKAVCGESMQGWRGGPLDPQAGPETWMDAEVQHA